MAANICKLRTSPTHKLLPGVIACWALLIWLVPRVGLSIAEQHAAASWPETTATVRTSGTYYHRLNKRVRFEYEYEVAGTYYTSKRRRCAWLSAYGLLEDKSGFVAAHPVGSVIRIRYNPADPQQATVQVWVSPLDVIPALAFLVAMALWTMGGTVELCRRSSGRHPPPKPDTAKG